MKKMEIELATTGYGEVITSIMQEFKNTSAALMEKIGNIAEQISKADIFPIAEEASRIGKVIEKLLNNILVNTNTAGPILMKYGWLIPPSMDLRLAKIISEIGGKPGNHRNEINKLFLEYYRRDNYMEIERMLNSWKTNKFFKKRMKILKDCLKLLQLPKNMYKINYANILIPALIAQIDGILTEYSVDKGFDIKKYPEYKLPKELKKYRTDIIQNIKTSDSLNVIDELSKNIIIDTLFGTAFVGHKPKTGYFSTRFYRHKIMHGEYVSYGSIYNVLRALFLLDYLSDLK